jgi:cell division protease FtsH
VLLGLLLALDWFVVLASQPSVPARVTVPYSYFVSQIHQSNVASVTGQGWTIQGTFRHSVTYPAHNGTTSTLFATTRPTFADDNLLSELLGEGVVVNAKPISSGSDPLLTILGGVLPTLLLVGFWLWIIQRYWGQMSQDAAGLGGGG